MVLVLIFLVIGIIFWYRHLLSSKSVFGHKVIIFDFNGTLCDLFNVVINEYNKLSQVYKFKPINSSSEIRDIPLKQILKSHGVTGWKLPLLVYKMRKAIAAQILDLSLFQGIQENRKH
ncbi:MAG: hypothetical protein LBL17_00580 [Coxiellaceae bacterium]|jgi:site-specific DNA-adenine methylase|nr:hypothetical protein [Coxiellaceae bacterium]